MVTKVQIVRSYFFSLKMMKNIKDIEALSSKQRSSKKKQAQEKGATIFDMEYTRWLDDDQRHMGELRKGLQSHLSDGDLRIIVDSFVAQYDDIFRLKGVAAKSDVFHLITGMWTTPAERYFLWMGGFRPSDLIKVSALWKGCPLPSLFPLRLTSVFEKKSFELLPAIPKPFLSLHLWFEPDMVAYSQCEPDMVTYLTGPLNQELKERIERVKEKSWIDGNFTSESEFRDEMMAIRKDFVTIHGEMVLLKNYSSLNFAEEETDSTSIKGGFSTSYFAN